MHDRIRHSSVELVDAVAASTSAMTPYPIGEIRYINGGHARVGYAQGTPLAPAMAEFWG